MAVKPRRELVRLAAAPLQKVGKAWRRFGVRGPHGAACRRPELQLPVCEFPEHRGRMSNSPARSYGAIARDPGTPFPNLVSLTEPHSFPRLRRLEHRFELPLALGLPVRREGAEPLSFRNPMARIALDAPISQSEAIIH